MYKIGDVVEVVNYGHKIYHRLNDEDDMTPLDLRPEYIGKVGIIVEVSERNTYCIDSIGAWFNNDQLKLIKEYSKAFTQKDFNEVSKRICIKLLNDMFYLGKPIVQNCKVNKVVSRTREDYKLCNDLVCESCNKFREYIDKYKLNG